MCAIFGELRQTPAVNVMDELMQERRDNIVNNEDHASISSGPAEVSKCSAGMTLSSISAFDLNVLNCQAWYALLRHRPPRDEREAQPRVFRKHAALWLAIERTYQLAERSRSRTNAW